jgi:N-acetylmuramoyl-L-alanine amidase
MDDLSTALASVFFPRSNPTPVPLRPQPVAPTKPAYTQDDLAYLMRTAFGEAEGEGPRGEQAVMYAIKNRLGKRKKWDTIQHVVQAPSQFESWAAGNPRRQVMENLKVDDPANLPLMQLAQAVLSGTAPDPTQGATLFYAPAKVQPSWASKAKETAVIGGHRFMTE